MEEQLQNFASKHFTKLKLKYLGETRYILKFKDESFMVKILQTNFEKKFNFLKAKNQNLSIWYGWHSPSDILHKELNCKITKNPKFSYFWLKMPWSFPKLCSKLNKKLLLFFELENLTLISLKFRNSKRHNKCVISFIQI